MTTFDPGLPDSLRPLARELEHDRPRLVVVVGAGVSIGATGRPQASWKGLLAHGLEHLTTSGRFQPGYSDDLLHALDQAFDPFDGERVLELAELIQQTLRLQNAAASWLENAFADFNALADRAATLQALSALQRAGALLVTTNYDGLLSDATGLSAVTPLGREGFLRAITRQAPAIVHLHGHWQTPESVVLGVRSYDRILDDTLFQDAFKSLWLQNCWLFVGCGNGLEDPNLGQLLRWGRQWGEAALPHRMLAIKHEAERLRTLDLPPRLDVVDFADFAALPRLLHALTPAARCAPFVRIDARLAQVRAAAASVDNPFPSWQEYLDDLVPKLQVDEEVRTRLRDHGWACVLDVASVGKTTLALRMAADAERSGGTAFYLDLAGAGPDEDLDPSTVDALRRLARPGQLLIVDNAHHAPVLTHALWSAWRSHPRGSRLLLIATESRRKVTTHAAQDFAHLSADPDNPAIPLHPQAEDLVRILHAIFRRFGRSRVALPTPPPAALAQWYRDFGQALGGFCCAVLGRRAQLLAGDWTLPPEAAADWVWERWLRRLDAEERANALCLAAFGSQELEMTVSQAALPFPQRITRLCELGLASETQHGQFLQYRRFAVREPDWGRLLIAAHLARHDTGVDGNTFTEGVFADQCGCNLAFSGSGGRKLAMILSLR
jgi:hypothetical protein